MSKGFKCIGIIPYKFRPQDSDQDLSGCTFWFADTPKKGYGLSPFKLSVSDLKFDDICTDLGIKKPEEFLERSFWINYNRYGKLDSLEFVG